MRNHEAILAMRLRGEKPEWVQVLLERCPRGDSEPARDYRGEFVFIEPDDRIAGLDMRFLVGCGVQISGEDPARVRQAYDAALRHEAARVVASSAHPVHETFEHDLVLDSAGELTWP